METAFSVSFVQSKSTNPEEWDAHQIVDRIWLGSEDAACGEKSEFVSRQIGGVLTVGHGVLRQCYPVLNSFSKLHSI